MPIGATAQQTTKTKPLIIQEQGGYAVGGTIVSTPGTYHNHKPSVAGTLVDARLVHFPEIGVRGNTHFIFSDLNNVEIANLVSMFLNEKRLDWSTATPSRSSPLDFPGSARDPSSKDRKSI